MELGRARYAQRIRALSAIVHFDTDVLTSDNGTTSTWTDRIGGYSVSSVAQATRLTYSASNSYLNNRPGWVGDGTRYMRGASALAALLGITNNHTIYFVATPVAMAGTGFVFGAGSTTAQEMIAAGMLNTGAANYRRRVAGTVDSVTGAVLIGSGARVIQSNVYSTNSAKLFANGVQSVGATATTAAPTNLDVISVGCSIGYSTADAVFAPFTGVIGDIVIFPTAHSNSDRSYVESILSAKYGWAA